MLGRYGVGVAVPRAVWPPCAEGGPGTPMRPGAFRAGAPYGGDPVRPALQDCPGRVRRGVPLLETLLLGRCGFGAILQASTTAVLAGHNIAAQALDASRLRSSADFRRPVPGRVRRRRTPQPWVFCPPWGAGLYCVRANRAPRDAWTLRLEGEGRRRGPRPCCSYPWCGPRARGQAGTGRTSARCASPSEHS